MDCHVRIGDLRPILVDRDNFDDILEKLKPTVNLQTGLPFSAILAAVTSAHRRHANLRLILPQD
jgi:predicted component of type VI protein secretion system